MLQFKTSVAEQAEQSVPSVCQAWLSAPMITEDEGALEERFGRQRQVCGVLFLSFFFASHLSETQIGATLS